jgi:hypothetical protein
MKYIDSAEPSHIRKSLGAHGGQLFREWDEKNTLAGRLRPADALQRRGHTAGSS